MKKLSFKLVALLALAAVTVSMAVPAFAAGKVSYDGNSQKFIFSPGSEHSPTDLFGAFKNVMPGDSITQKLTVRNESSNGVKVKIYMRSRGAHEDSVDFLSKLHLTVNKSGTNTMPYMFDAAADQTDGLTDWVLLGTLYSGGEVNLDVTLTLPIELGNEYQDAVGYLDWEFKVEEYPVDPGDPVPPPTGDESSIYVYVMLACVCVVVLFIFIPKRKKDISDN